LPDSSFPFRILIVEDDPRLREVGKLLLESQRYEVHVAGDGFEALIALKRSLPDIIISDLRVLRLDSPGEYPG
jgi:CheY-like chemotaxis protein